MEHILPSPPSDSQPRISTTLGRAREKADRRGLRAEFVVGDVLHLLCFSEHTPGHDGPRRVTQADLRAAFTDGWEVERIEPARLEVKEEWRGEAPHAWLARIVRMG